MENRYNIDFYRNFKKFVDFYMEHMYKLQISNLENIPTDNNYLLAGNHLNILDSWLLMSAVDEPIRFMVDQKLYRYKLWKLFFETMGTFPINPNEIDIKAVKTAVEILKAGEIECIFPEGKTHSKNNSVPFKNGVSSIAVLAKKQVIPFAIGGSYKPRSELNLTFGNPINFKEIPKNERDPYLESVVRKLEKDIK